MPQVSYSVKYPAITTENNVNKYVKLLEACIGNVKRVVAASSSSVYGTAEELPTDELEKRDPQSPYALQKCVLEDFSKLFCNLYDIDIVCLRYFNVFGKNQIAGSPYSTAVAAWCHAIKNNLPLRSDGDGTQSRDLCHVDNVVNANILVAQRPGNFQGNVYNICCGERFTNNEILEFLKERFPYITVKEAPWRSGDVMHTEGDWSTARDDFGYKPNIEFWDGFEKNYWMVGTRCQPIKIKSTLRRLGLHDQVSLQLKNPGVEKNRGQVLTVYMERFYSLTRVKKQV